MATIQDDIRRCCGSSPACDLNVGFAAALRQSAVGSLCPANPRLQISSGDSSCSAGCMQRKGLDQQVPFRTLQALSAVVQMWCRVQMCLNVLTARRRHALAAMSVCLHSSLARIPRADAATLPPPPAVGNCPDCLGAKTPVSHVFDHGRTASQPEWLFAATDPAGIFC